MSLDNISDIDSDDIFSDEVFDGIDYNSTAYEKTSLHSISDDSLDINEIDLSIQDKQDRDIYMEKKAEETEIIFSDIEEEPINECIEECSKSNDECNMNVMGKKENTIYDHNMKNSYSEYNNSSSEINDFSSFLTVPEEENKINELKHDEIDNENNVNRPLVNDTEITCEENYEKNNNILIEKVQNNELKNHSNNILIETGFTTGNKKKKISVNQKSIEKIGKIINNNDDCDKKTIINNNSFFNKQVPKDRPSRVYQKPIIPKDTRIDDKLKVIYNKVYNKYKNVMEKKELDEAFKWGYLRHYKSIFDSINNLIIEYIDKRNKTIYSPLYRIITKDDNPNQPIVLLILKIINNSKLMLYDGYYNIVGIVDYGIKRKLIEQRIKVFDKILIMNSSVLDEIVNDDDVYFKQSIHVNNNSYKIISNNIKLGYYKYKTFLYNLHNALVDCGNIPFIEMKVLKIIESKGIIKIGSFKRIVNINDIEKVMEEIKEIHNRNKEELSEYNINMYQKVLFIDIHFNLQGIVYIYNSNDSILKNKKYRIYNVRMKEYRMFIGRMEYVEEL